jgi:pimeloyl-ACP methyl ester carboxylesterase
MQLKVNNRIVYVYTGAKDLIPDQNTVVFIHGAGLDHTVWLLQSRYFAHHGWNVVALDLPGHGHSHGPALSNIETMADWVVQLLDGLGIEQAAVVGHSMGSLVTLETGARHPQRVNRLALLGTSIPMLVSEPLLNAAKNNDHSAFDMITLWGHGHAAQLGGHPVPGMWMIGNTVRLLEYSPPGVLYMDLNACNQYHNGLDSARQLRCPVLLVLARQDRMTPVTIAEDLIHSIGNLHIVFLDDCGHMMLAEQPDQVLDAIKTFLLDGRT